ncbi:MAG TPA: hypothetical protein VG265_07035 [Gaiellaceae bacterium]|nr:hypothetical protein [Gaiellaceae bacterium]
MRRPLALVGIAFLASIAAGSAAAIPPAANVTPLPELAAQQVPFDGIVLQLPKTWFPLASPSSSQVVGLFRAPEQKDGLYVNLDVVAEPLGKARTLEDWLGTTIDPSYLKVGAIRIVSVHGVHGIEYSSTKAVAFHSKPVFTDAYFFVYRDAVLQFTYSSFASDRVQYAPLFAASAQTIRFGANAAGSSGVYGG